MIRWGVIGPGAIAAGFADAMQMVDGGEIVAVASRAAERAEAFGDRFGIPARYGDYVALAEDPDVDVVYVATPQSRHEDDTLDLLEAGKHVLCEKPFALNAGQARTDGRGSAQPGAVPHGGHLEPVPARLPHLVDVVGDGRIGEPLLVEADFGFRRPVDPEDRPFVSTSAAAACSTSGIYPAPALHAAARARRARRRPKASSARPGSTSRWPRCCGMPDGKLGVIKAALRVGMTCTARISGTDGVIEIPALMHCPNSLTVTSRGRRRGDRRLLRRERVALRDRGGAPLPRRRARPRAPTMTLDETFALASHARRHPGPDRLVFPGE